MTTFDGAREAVYEAFDAGWGTRTVRQLEGIPFTEPKPDIEWIRVVVRNLGGTTDTMGDEGSKKFTRNASVIMSVFTPADQGMKSGAEHARIALNIFESKNIAVPGGSEEISFIAGDVRELPLEEDAKSRQINIEVPFDFFQTK